MLSADDDMAALIEAWAHKKMYGRLLELWVRGLNITGIASMVSVASSGKPAWLSILAGELLDSRDFCRERAGELGKRHPPRGSFRLASRCFIRTPRPWMGSASVPHSAAENSASLNIKRKGESHVGWGVS